MKRIERKRTTLCYIRRNGQYLMLLRNKKEKDENAGKWIGVGGKIEPGETPEECLLREVREETGLVLKDYRYRGLIQFLSDRYVPEDMYLYTADEFEGELRECDEGELRWIPQNQVLSLKLWEGDRVFLEELLRDEKTDVSCTLRYEGDRLVQVIREAD